MKIFNAELLGKEITFIVPGEGEKCGRILQGEFCPGFIGYTVRVDSEDCDYGGVFQNEDATFTQQTLRLC